MELPGIISDLALMLLLAGIMTIIFKKLKQPLVLGYIVAGFLVSSYCTIMPTVSDIASIDTWSEIGIIVIMFALGLEFDLHKLAKAGGTAIITALTEVLCLGCIGYGIGQAMGWTSMESLFLGGMLGMSSTMIILKAYEDLGLRREKFTDTVLGVLIVEDIAGIFMMILLTTISVSQNVSGLDLAVQMLCMLLYLALWLVAGIYLIPTLIKKAKDMLNDETLLVIALGACFGMVLLANFLGFSSALGAFMAGSIFAGTAIGGRTEHVVKPVKDLFGAVFFLSVGMMVQPQMIAAYWLPILIITAAVLLFMPIFGTIGMLLSGQSLHTAVRAGTSFVQIGEFSFIIAALGNSLGVISDFIYPIIVSVSVVTIFITPFYIKSGEKMYGFLQRILPEKLRKQLDRYTSDKQSEQEKNQEWSAYIKSSLGKIALYAMICVAADLAGAKLLLPWLATIIDPLTAKLINISLLLLINAPFINAMMRNRNKYYVRLWTQNRANRPPLVAFTILRVLVGIVLLLLAFQFTFSFFSPWIAVAALALVLVIGRSRLLSSSYLWVEARFLSNLNERQLEESNKDHNWLDEKMLVSKTVISPGNPIIGKNLAELRWGAIYDINIIKIIRGKKNINIPEGNAVLAANDIIYAIGDLTQLDTWLMAINEKDTQDKMPTLRHFINNQNESFARQDQLFTYALRIDKSHDLTRKSIRESGIKSRFSCILIGLERNLLPIYRPRPDMILRNDDILWLLGTDKMASKLLINGVLPDMGETEEKC